MSKGPVSESRWTRPREDCPHPEWWTSADIDATEFEVIEGFAGLVRLLQPEYVIETGTYRGFMAQAIGEALKRNGHGHLDTIEHSPEFGAEARGRISGLPVAYHSMKSLEFKPRKRIDMLWLDTDFHARADEFRAYLPQMHPGTIAAFHDAGPHHGTVLKSVMQLGDEGLCDWMYLATPRGLILAQPRLH